MFNIFINYSNTGITGQYQMSSAKEMRFMQIYSENERKNKRVKELILGWQTRYFMFNCFNGIKR